MNPMSTNLGVGATLSQRCKFIKNVINMFLKVTYFGVMCVRKEQFVDAKDTIFP